MAITSQSETIKVLEPLRVPDAAQLDEARELFPGGDSATPEERARELTRRGLLGDLGELMGVSCAGVRGRSVDDLGELIETFAALQEIVYGVAAPTELRLRDCRIDRSDLSSLDATFPLHVEHCIFTSEVKLLGTTFHKPARFVGSEFLREANFFAATFTAGADFSGAHFHGPVDFRGATVGGPLNFLRANFDNGLELKFARFESDATVNLAETKFHSSNVMGGSLSMGRAQFRRGIIAGEQSADLHALIAACEQYGELEANFASQGSPDSTQSRDLCHYRYMDLRRRTTHSRRNPRRMLDWLFLKWCFGYGVYTRRILASGLCVIALFALLYICGSLALPAEHWGIHYGPDASRQFFDNNHPLDSFGTALYFSTITFATVGYGDWYPTHWARLAAAMEGLSGIFIMSVFTVSFARKIIR